jgi:hypothetical protein
MQAGLTAYCAALDALMVIEVPFTFTTMPSREAKPEPLRTIAFAAFVDDPAFLKKAFPLGDILTLVIALSNIH